jgi:ribosome biogenesis protein ERB1
MKRKSVERVPDVEPVLENESDEDIPEINAFDESEDELNESEIEGEVEADESGESQSEYSDDQVDTGIKNDGSDYDSDDGVGHQNKIGRIPLEWYNDYPHIGYDLDGKKIMKPAKGDELDAFLKRMDDPKYWKTIHDRIDDKDIVLTPEEIEIISKIQSGHYAAPDYDPYEPSVDFFTYKQSIHPVTNVPEPKSRFIPSKWEHKRVMKIVRAIRKGWIIPNKPKEVQPKYFDIWGNVDIESKASSYIAAPKMKMPHHNESYNPHEEYVPTPEEVAEWEKMDPEDRMYNYIPKKYSALRLVPGYDNFIQERFARCLDLYMCPRVKKNRINIDPESLIPKLPHPKTLKPFPTTQTISYDGHEGKIRSFSVDPTGQFLVSGSDDMTVRLWEVLTGRCLNVWYFDEIVQQVSWNPNKSFSFFVVAVGNRAVFINPNVADEEVIQKSDETLLDLIGKETNFVEWKAASKGQFEEHRRIEIVHKFNVKQISWHRKGDYFSTVIKNASTTSVFIHQLTKKTTQNPFKQLGGQVQKVMFHPTEALFYVATQRSVRIYNLAKQELEKKLMPGMKWISSFDIHPKGDNVVLGGYDKKVCWIDLDLGVTPYKTLKYHKFAVRQVSFHRKYPLFASCSDDGNIHVFHGMVYNDLMQNALIVPVKVIKAHRVTDSLGTLHCEFHPHQPWIFSSGSDGQLQLFT